MFGRLYRGFLVLCLTLIVCCIYFSLNNYYYAEEEGTEVIYDETAANLKHSESLKAAKINSQDKRLVLPCGNPVGIYVKSDGVLVVSIGKVSDLVEGELSPCKDKLKQGDYIVLADENEVKSKDELIDYVKASKGQEVKLTVRRGEEFIDVYVTPANTKSGYMLGIWVKDDVSGIGTLTYVNNDGFAALGHSINDNDTGLLFEISDGAIFKTRLVNIVKPADKQPGRLEGVIDYTSGCIWGRIQTNSNHGIYGYITEDGLNDLDNNEWVEVADDTDISLGAASIISYVSGEREEYRIEITKINYDESDGKNLEIKVTDERLLAITGGIVQGMSGTPIMQNGKLIGAVTHVFVKDATRGYGVFIEEMMGE